MTEQFYPFKLSREARVGIWVGVLFGIASFAIPIYKFGLWLPAIVLWSVVLSVTLIPYYAIGWFAPQGAILSADGIRIVTRSARRPVVFPASEIVALQRIDRRVTRRIIRTWGTGTGLGSWGHFTNKQLGAFRAYLTNLDSLVLIRTVSEGPVVISPDTPDDFIAQAESFGLTPSRTEDTQELRTRNSGFTDAASRRSSPAQGRGPK